MKPDRDVPVDEHVVSQNNWPLCPFVEQQTPESLIPQLRVCFLFAKWACSYSSSLYRFSASRNVIYVPVLSRILSENVGFCFPTEKG